MKREGFVRYVEELEKYIDREKPSTLSIEDISMILGISPNYARAVAKAVANKRGYIYHMGTMYIRREEGQVDEQ